MDNTFAALKLAAALAIIAGYLRLHYALVYSDQALPRIKRLTEWASANPEAVRRGLRAAQAAAGLFLMVFGYWIGREHFRLIRLGARASGTIVAYQKESLPEGARARRQRMSMPVVRFQAGDRTVEFQDWMASPAEVLNVSVPVLYDPADPRVAMIDRPVWNWIPWAPIFGVGSFLLLVAALG